MRRFKHLTRADRLKIEALLRENHAVRDIAAHLGVHVSTIYREVKRGLYIHTNSDLTEEVRYSPELADMKYRENLKAKGSDLKIGRDHKLAEYLEHKIVDDGYSPAAALGDIKSNGLRFSTSLTKATLYSYIDKGIFLRLTNKYLPIKGRRHKQYKKVFRQKRAHAGTSIEKRPEYIKDRTEFGHWEMDTVVGRKGKSLHTMLVFTELKTRMELVRLMPDRKCESVIAAIDNIELKLGDAFKKIFKTITVDNGSEFADSKGLARSVLSEGERSALYYCHPYCSYERGSNENQNRLIRRKIPKGTDFDDKTEEDIQEIEDWINNYPREIFGWKTAAEMFRLELEAIGI